MELSPRTAATPRTPHDSTAATATAAKRVIFRMFIQIGFRLVFSDWYFLRMIQFPG